MRGQARPTQLVEAILLVSSRPLGTKDLASATGLTEPEVDEALADLTDRYSPDRSGIVLRSVANGYHLATNPACSEAVERFRKELRPTPLSNAAYEVLSCALYLGPLTRGEVSTVRGVNSDAVVRSLLERGLLSEVGSDRSVPGSPSRLDVTREFLAASGASTRRDFPELDSLVAPEELARVRERIEESTREAPAPPEEEA